MIDIGDGAEQEQVDELICISKIHMIRL